MQSVTTQSAVGFIGLGLMGSGFTRRLIATGRRVIGYDVVPDKDAAAAIMAGGSDAAVATARSVMQHLGKFTHMGATGAGQAAKLVNQTLVLAPLYCLEAST